MDEVVAWQCGVDLIRAGKPVVAFLNLTERQLRLEVQPCVAAAGETLGHDSFARWVRTGADDALSRHRAVDRGMDL